MAVAGPILEDRFEGSLLGLAIGDALGGKFEARSADAIRARFPAADRLIAYPQEEIWYTDDTQMAIGVAEALAERGEVVEEVLCRTFVANFVPSRGYGRGARVVLDAMEDGRDYRQVAEEHFPGGSYGNGAAMRVAPVGWTAVPRRPPPAVGAGPAVRPADPPAPSGHRGGTAAGPRCRPVLADGAVQPGGLLR